jgi:hypothetical protein
VQADGLDGQAIPTLRVFGEELAKVDDPDLRVMLAKSFPGRAIGERNRCHVGLLPDSTGLL